MQQSYYTCAYQRKNWNDIVVTWLAVPAITPCLVLQEISKYLRNPHKPAILAMSRPDPKKNITTLVKAFGENKTLRGLANLVLIMVSCCTLSNCMCDKLFRAILFLILLSFVPG
jgi:hypothetical protein